MHTISKSSSITLVALFSSNSETFWPRFKNYNLYYNDLLFCDPPLHFDTTKANSLQYSLFHPHLKYLSHQKFYPGSMPSKSLLTHNRKSIRTIFLSFGCDAPTLNLLGGLCVSPSLWLPKLLLVLTLSEDKPKNDIAEPLNILFISPSFPFNAQGLHAS